jgi:hypothetical protein
MSKRYHMVISPPWAAWSNGLAECQVKFFVFPWNDKDSQAHFPHGITMSVLALKSFSDTVLLEIIVQLANWNFGTTSGTIKGLPFLALCRCHQPSLGPYSDWHPFTHWSQAGRFHYNDTVKASDAQFTNQFTNDGNHFRVKYGKIGSFRYTPAQILWNDLHPRLVMKTNCFNCYHLLSTFTLPRFQLTFSYPVISPLVPSRGLSPSIWHGDSLPMKKILITAMQG